MLYQEIDREAKEISISNWEEKGVLGGCSKRQSLE
jgi:hypothetical protein